MTPTQYEEFNQFALRAKSYVPIEDDIERAMLFNAMRLAYNAAVRKCAETAEAKFCPGGPNEGPGADIDKDSILKNLIE